MRPFVKGEDVEQYLVEMTRELVEQQQTTGKPIPRLTTAERDALKVVSTGILIHNTTTNKLNFCDDPSNATPANRWSVVTSS